MVQSKKKNHLKKSFPSFLKKKESPISFFSSRKRLNTTNEESSESIDYIPTSTDSWNHSVTPDGKHFFDHTINNNYLNDIEQKESYEEPLEDDFTAYFIRGRTPLKDFDDKTEFRTLKFWSIFLNESGLRRNEDVNYDKSKGTNFDDTFDSYYIPNELEKVIFLGFFLCADSLLFMLVYFPFRFLKALFLLIHQLVFFRQHRKTKIDYAESFDLLRGFIIFVVVNVLMCFTYISRLPFLSEDKQLSNFMSYLI